MSVPSRLYSRRQRVNQRSILLHHPTGRSPLDISEFCPFRASGSIRFTGSSSASTATTSSSSTAPSSVPFLIVSQLLPSPTLLFHRVRSPSSSSFSSDRRRLPCSSPCHHSSSPTNRSDETPAPDLPAISYPLSLFCLVVSPSLLSRSFPAQTPRMYATPQRFHFVKLRVSDPEPEKCQHPIQTQNLNIQTLILIMFGLISSIYLTSPF
ncbi:hypothetical protein Bca52824_028754 [Brassica carinata]|uniref:Uncharacterized protein n=1 Tax=Brassica carinata TaxID=52824 RepID=A0A8X7VD21_BRACI|nr:hypothetical protein Bca52824_028754 [Brassica carinata]